MQTKITVNPTDVGDIRHQMYGTGEDIPILSIGPVHVVLYDFHLDHGQMSAWLADLSAHALELAAQIDEKWPVEDEPEPVEQSPYGLALVEGVRQAREAGEI